MSLQRFFDNFAALAEAPNSVAKLRELILQLAVEGKLVCQQPNEESGAELLKRIQIEKERRRREGKLRKFIPPKTIKRNEIPFDLPTSWKWTRLSQLCELENGDRGKNYPSRRELVSDGVPFINAGHLQSGAICLDSMNYISERRYNLLKSGKVQDGDILFCLRGSLGKSALVRNLSQAAIASSLVIIRLIADLNRQFVLNYLFSTLADQMIRRFDNGTAQPNLSSADLGKFLFPLPPIEEQDRIVTKVDELMRLCDKLEAHQRATRESRVRLNTALLAPLNKAASLTPEEFEQATTRLAENFDTLYVSIDTVSKLRATVLQLAVQGKLVAPDRRDEPAASLVKRIGQQRQRLLTPLELKKVEPQRSSDGMVIPFRVPAGWKWIRLGEISAKLGAGSTPLGGKNVYQGEGVKFLRSQNVWNDGLHLNNVAYISETIHKQMSGTHVQDGDILLNITGASIGRSCVVPEHLGRANVSQHVSIIRLVDKRLRFFIHLCIISPYVQDSIMQSQVGISREGLSMRNLKEFLLPIPPLDEQNRIVAKVNQLMSLCDDFEAKLRQAEADSEKLMNAAVKHVLDSVRNASETAEEVFA